MADPSDGGSPHKGAADPDAPGANEPGAIDLEGLTDRVYRLFEADIRLGRARGEAALRGPRWRK